MEEENTNILKNSGTQKVEGNDQQTIKNSDYPQTQNLANDILTGQQDTKANMVNTRTDDLSQNNNINKNYTKIVEGITGRSYISLLNEYNNSILKINNMIVEELKTCFILVY